MNPTTPSAAEDLSKLSDEELVRRYCATPPNKDSFDVLFRRYEPSIKRRAEQYAKEMEPASYADISSEINQNLSKGVCTFKFREPFSHFLSVLMKNAAYDVWRRETHARAKNPPPRPVPLDDLEPHEQDKLIYESTVGKADEKPKPEKRPALTPEGKRTLSKALDQHRPENPVSNETLKAHYKRNRKVKTLAARSGKSEDEILEIITENTERLRVILKDKFHIEHIDQLFQAGGT